MKTIVTRRKLSLTSYHYEEAADMTFEGSGDEAPKVQQLDPNRAHPGNAYQLLVPKPGLDDDGDRKADRYTIHGAIAWLHGQWMVIEGYVVGDGRYDSDGCTCGDPRRKHSRGLKGRGCSREDCGCEAFQPAQEQYHVERWDIVNQDEEALTLPTA